MKQPILLFLPIHLIFKATILCAHYFHDEKRRDNGQPKASIDRKYVSLIVIANYCRKNGLWENNWVTEETFFYFLLFIGPTRLSGLKYSI